jgi:hypothetical protein
MPCAQHYDVAVLTSLGLAYTLISYTDVRDVTAQLLPLLLVIIQEFSIFLERITTI